mmetsp:Transcript_11882/g.35095  ORF Transcript_11882/g.35095 Transcript_11882/m.35095 type:complete len:203 (-) Transcript_11882:20-628(-)
MSMLFTAQNLQMRISLHASAPALVCSIFINSFADFWSSRSSWCRPFNRSANFKPPSSSSWSASLSVGDFRTIHMSAFAHRPETGASSIQSFNTSIMTSSAPASVSSFRFFFATPGTSLRTLLLILSQPSITRSRPFGFNDPSILFTSVLLGMNRIWTWSFVGRYWPMTSILAGCYRDCSRCGEAARPDGLLPRGTCAAPGCF